LTVPELFDPPASLRRRCADEDSSHRATQAQAMTRSVDVKPHISLICRGIFAAYLAAAGGGHSKFVWRARRSYGLAPSRRDQQVRRTDRRPAHVADHGRRQSQVVEPHRKALDLQSPASDAIECKTARLGNQRNRQIDRRVVDTFENGGQFVTHIPKNLKSIAAWPDINQLKGLQRDTIAEQPHLEVESVKDSRSIGHVQRLELDERKLDPSYSRDFLVEAAVAQVATAAGR
jgi:hypothetical protein